MNGWLIAIFVIILLIFISITSKTVKRHSTTKGLFIFIFVMLIILAIVVFIYSRKVQIGDPGYPTSQDEAAQVQIIDKENDKGSDNKDGSTVYVSIEGEKVTISSPNLLGVYEEKVYLQIEEVETELSKEREKGRKIELIDYDYAHYLTYDKVRAIVDKFNSENNEKN